MHFAQENPIILKQFFGCSGHNYKFTSVSAVQRFSADRQAISSYNNSSTFHPHESVCDTEFRTSVASRLASLLSSVLISEQLFGHFLPESWRPSAIN